MIKDNLRENIKPDSSQVIEGRFQALRSDNLSHQEFSKQAEELSESLKRTLISEGMPDALAKEYTVKKAIEVCRNSARSNLVKSVLASTHFSSPKEVIAKFVVEIATESKEKQVLSFNANRHNNSRGRNNFRGRNYRNYNDSNPNHSRNQRNNSFQNNSGHFSYNNNPQRNSNFNNSYRGSHGTSNSNRGGNNRGYRGQRTNYNNHNNASVRYIDAGNYHDPFLSQTGNYQAPQQRTLGENDNNSQRH